VVVFSFFAGCLSFVALGYYFSSSLIMASLYLKVSVRFPASENYGSMCASQYLAGVRVCVICCTFLVLLLFLALDKAGLYMI